MQRLPAVVTAIALVFAASAACSKPPPKTIDELRDADISTTLEYVRDLDETDSFTAYLVAYTSGGLRVHSMVAVPKCEKPAGGFPVVVANHGHHPDPPKYGITADGIDSRPGDYYRSVPDVFARRCFLVVMPDFRGHNNSEGYEFTEGMLEASYYAEDVVTLLSGLGDIEHADLDNVFMWGHSMGGEVTLRTLAIVEGIRGASIWSSVGGDIWDQSYYYSRYIDELAEDSIDVNKSAIEALKRDIDKLDGEYDPRDNEPLLHLEYLTVPLNIHHARGDRGAAYKWSEKLAKELYMRDHPYHFYTYDSNDHYFDAEAREIAADRDADFFRSLMPD